MFFGGGAPPLQWHVITAPQPPPAREVAVTSRPLNAPRIHGSRPNRLIGPSLAAASRARSHAKSRDSRIRASPRLQRRIGQVSVCNAQWGRVPVCNAQWGRVNAKWGHLHYVLHYVVHCVLIRIADRKCAIHVLHVLHVLYNYDAEKGQMTDACRERQTACFFAGQMVCGSHKGEEGQH